MPELSALRTKRYKHTPSGCLVLLNTEFIGVCWYNFSPTFPKPRHVNSALKKSCYITLEEDIYPLTCLKKC